LLYPFTFPRRFALTGCCWCQQQIMLLRKSYAAVLLPDKPLKKPFLVCKTALIRIALRYAEKMRVSPFFILPLQNFCLNWQV